MQCAYAILSSVTCPVLQYFSTFSHKRHDFRKKNKVTEHKMCFLIFSTTFFWNISHTKKIWTRCNKKYIRLHVKYPLFLSDFNETLIFVTNFRKILKFQISWKSVHLKSIRSVRTDRRTDMTNLIVAFRNFANSPKKTGGKMDGTQTRRERCRQLLCGLNEHRRYWSLKGAAVDCTVWKNRFGRI